MSVIILNWALCSATIIVAAVPVVLISSLVDSLLCRLTLLAASIAVAADGSKKLKYKMYIMQRCVGRHYAVADIAKLCGSRPPTGQPVLKIPRMESFFQTRRDETQDFLAHEAISIVFSVCVEVGCLNLGEIL